MHEPVRTLVYTRRHPRARLDIPITQLAEHGPIEISLADISASGALLVDPLVPVFGEARVHVRIRLPGQTEEIEASGLVVRDVEEEGVRLVGIEFDVIANRARELIVDFVKDRRGFG